MYPEAEKAYESQKEGGSKRERNKEKIADIQNQR